MTLQEFITHSLVRIKGGISKANTSGGTLLYAPEKRYLTPFPTFSLIAVAFPAGLVIGTHSHENDKNEEV